MKSPENAANAKDVNYDILGKTPATDATGQPVNTKEEELKKNELRYMDMNNKDLLKKVLQDCNYIIPSPPQNQMAYYGDDISEYSRELRARSRNIGS